MTSQVQNRKTKPKRLIIDGFKCFRDRTEIELAPLTILAGANSSGKSSLMQPFLLLKQTFEVPYDPGPLLLSGPNVMFSEVRQLFWHAPRDPRKDFTVGLDLGGIGGEITFVVDIPQKSKKISNLLVEKCKWFENGYSFTVHSRMKSEDLIAILKEIPRYKNLLQALSKTKLTVTRWKSMLVPFSEVLPLPGPWLPFEFFLRSLIHVPGLRGNPQRSYKYTAVREAYPGLFQDYVASVISYWQEKKPSKLEKLGEWLHHLGMTWKVEAKRVSATEIRLRVGRLPERGGARDVIDIADVGFGVSQVLPVVVALLTEKSVVYVEQPEIHLHPRAQVRLADLIAEAVKRGVQVIVETHSELLLLGIQKLVASGELSPEMVKLHWFERDEKGVAHVTTADLDESGSFGDWPVDFTAVSLETMKQYLDASLKNDEVS